jgi:hypothetical protein
MALLWVDGFEKYGLSGNSVTPSETINWKYGVHAPLQVSALILDSQITVLN